MGRWTTRPAGLPCGPRTPCPCTQDRAGLLTAPHFVLRLEALVASVTHIPMPGTHPKSPHIPKPSCVSWFIPFHSWPLSSLLIFLYTCGSSPFIWTHPQVPSSCLLTLCLCLQSASDGFWKSVATRVPKEPPEIRILNPYFIQEAAFTLIGLPFNNGLMGRGVRLLGRAGGRGLDRGASGGKRVGKEAHPWKWADELWGAQPHPPSTDLYMFPLLSPLPEHPNPWQCSSDHGTTWL